MESLTTLRYQQSLCCHFIDVSNVLDSVNRESYYFTVAAVNSVLCSHFIGVSNVLASVNGESYYVTVAAVNSVGLKSYAFSGAITVDNTAPTAGKVVDLRTTFQTDSTDNDNTLALTKKYCTTDEGRLFAFILVPSILVKRFSTQSCRPSFLSAYFSFVNSQHVVPASLRRHVRISVHIGRSWRIDATPKLRLRYMTSIMLAHFWLLLLSRCRVQGGFRLRFTRILPILIIYSIICRSRIFKVQMRCPSLLNCRKWK